MKVKYLAQEHNTMSPAWARTRTARSGVERTNHEATAPPTVVLYLVVFVSTKVLSLICPVVQGLDNAIHGINRYPADVLTKQTTLSTG